MPTKMSEVPSGCCGRSNKVSLLSQDSVKGQVAGEHLRPVGRTLVRALGRLRWCQGPGEAMGESQVWPTQGNQPRRACCRDPAPPKPRQATHLNLLLHSDGERRPQLSPVLEEVRSDLRGLCVGMPE